MTQVKNVLLNVYEEKLVKNAEKRIFLHLLATRWGRNRSETPFSDSQRPITPILTPHPTLYSQRWPNALKCERPTFTHET